MLEGISGTERRLQRSRAERSSKNCKLLAHCAAAHRLKTSAIACYPELESVKDPMAILSRLWLQDAHIARYHEFHEYAHRFVLHAYAERTMSGRIWVPRICIRYSGHRSETSSDHVARRRGAFDRDAVQVGVFIVMAGEAASRMGRRR